MANTGMRYVAPTQWTVAMSRLNVWKRRTSTKRATRGYGLFCEAFGTIRDTPPIFCTDSVKQKHSKRA